MLTTQAGYDPDAAVTFFAKAETYLEQQIQMIIQRLHGKKDIEKYRKRLRHLRGFFELLDTHPKVCSYLLGRFLQLISV